MTKLLAFTVFAVALQTFSLRASEIPEVAVAIFEKGVSEQAARGELVSKFPSSDFNALIAEWGVNQQRAISDEARAMLVAEAMVSEYQVAKDGAASVHDFAKRGLLGFLGEDLASPKVLPVLAWMRRDLGDYSMTARGPNKLATLAFPTLTSGRVVDTKDRVVVEFAKVSRITLPVGTYKLTEAGASCADPIVIGPGEVQAPSCR